MVLCPARVRSLKPNYQPTSLLETMPARIVDGARSKEPPPNAPWRTFSHSCGALPPFRRHKPSLIDTDARANSLLVGSLPSANDSRKAREVRAAQGLRMELVSLSAEGIPLQPRRLSHLGVILLHCADRAPWFGRLLAPRRCVVISSTRRRTQDRCVYARHRTKRRAPMPTSPRVEEDWICHSLPCHRHRRPHRRP